VNSVEFIDPISGSIQGGGNEFGAFPCYGSTGYPFPPVVTLNPITVTAGKKNVFIHKRKLGVVTTTNYVIKAYPNRTTLISIDW
jgi:hypothetical protein